MKAQKRRQLEANAAWEHEVEKQRLTKTIREMVKHVPSEKRGQYLKVVKDVEKTSANAKNGSVEPEAGLVVLAPQPAAIATPVAPLVAGAMPAQAVVVAAPQVGAGGKQPKVTQSSYVLPQFAVGSNVPMYAQATGPKKDNAKIPKAKTQAAPKRGASVPPKSGTAGRNGGRDGRAASVGPKIPPNDEFVKT